MLRIALLLSHNFRLKLSPLWASPARQRAKTGSRGRSARVVNGEILLSAENSQVKGRKTEFALVGLRVHKFTTHCENLVTSRVRQRARQC